MQDQTRLSGVVLLGRHDDGLVTAEVTALADEREQTTGRAEPPPPVGVQGLPELALDELGFRDSILGLEGRVSGLRTRKARRPLRPWPRLLPAS